MSKFTKISLVIIGSLIVAAVLPFLNGQNSGSTITASDEIRLTKGAEVKHPALGTDFITWVEFRDGAYNLFAYNFFTKQESKINTSPLSSDVVGPVAFQNYVYLADHTATGWNIVQFDVEHGLSKVLKTEDKTIQSLAAYENYVVYEAKNGGTTDIFLLNKNVTKVEEMVKNITNDEVYQKAPVIFGNLMAWTEFPALATDSANYNSKFGQVVTYDVLSNVRKVIKDHVADLGNASINNWGISWSELEGSTKVVKVYGYSTGTSFNVSPSDFHSFGSVMSGDSVIYFVSRASGVDLELYQFSTGKYTVLSWSNATKKEPIAGVSSRFVAWIDNRLGTYDLYYFDALAVSPQNTPADVINLDQENDGLTDAEEIKLGSSTFLADTDNDGLTDYEEVRRYHTYPTQYDSDGDGIKDGEEVNNWLSDPLKFDSNDDGIDDKTSISEGYNPMADRSKLTVYRTIKMENPVQEKQEADYLKRTLNNYLGYGRWSVNSEAEWKKLTTAYSYGGYNIKEIASYLRGNKSAVSFNTMATVWREQQAIAQLSSN